MFDWLKKIQDKVKDLNTSVNTYQKETDKQTIPALAYVNRAKKLIEKSRFEEAKLVLAEALQISDKDAIVYKYLGIAEERLNNFESAAEYYKKSAAINPSDKNIWYRLAMSEFNLKYFEDAEKSFEKADKVSPVNTDILTGWGMTLLKRKKYNLAHEKLLRAAKINRYNFMAIFFAAIVEVKLGLYDAAETKLSFLLSVKPNEGACYEYANLLFLKGNYDSAVSLAQRAVQYNCNMLPAYLLLGKIYSVKFDYEKTTMWFKEALNSELVCSSLYAEWGNALVRLYRFEEAKEMFAKVLECYDRDIDAVSGLALCAAETNDLENANDLIKEIGVSDNIFIREAKGVLAFAAGNITEAVEVFKNVLKQEPDEIYNYFRLAKCYEKLGNDDMVRDSYDKFTKFCPNYAAGYLEYAKFLIFVQDYKDAQRKLRKAEKLDITNQEILNLLFYTSYILVKNDVCEYNIKEAISLADKIEKFEYPEQRADLEILLKNIKEN